MKKKLFTLMTLLLCLCSGAWATDLVNEDFTSWTPKSDFKKGDNVVNGWHFYCKNDGDFTLSEENGLHFAAKISSTGYYVGIPLTGINGQITITFTHTYSEAKAIFRYVLDDGATTCSGPGGTGTQVKDVSNSDTQCSVTIDVTNTNAYLYIGADGTTYPNLKSLKVTTPTLTRVSSSVFYPLYAGSEKTYSQLIDAANFHENYLTTCTSTDSGSGNSSSLGTPHDFSSISSTTKYYRLKPGTSHKIVLASIANVKSIRLYGNGSGASGSIVTTVKKISGTGTAMTIANQAFSSGKTSILEFSTGDLTALSGYDANTYYTYTITFTGGSFSLWGIYVEVPAGPTLSVDPATANAFTYVVGDGHSAAQEFTVTGSNLTDDDITVSLQEGSSYYEISSDNSTFGTSNLTVASGDKVYVRLKAGLAKRSSYAGTLRFANDGTDDVDIALSGSVTGQTYEITKGSATNGSITVVSSAEGDATVDISAEGNTGYEFSSWNIYKTGDPTTTISPAAATASTTFTMPAYAVTVDASFAAKTYTVTLDNQSATTAGTESVTTTYNANTNLTSSIVCPAMTDYVFMGYYTAANGEGKRLIDNSGAWIASVDGYTDASKNWIKDGGVTLYACWMKYATSADFNVYAYANIPREKTGVTSTSTDFSYLSNKNISYTFGNNTALDHSKNANFIGLKMKNSTDYIKFAVESGKQVTVIFGRANADPKLYIDGTESTIDLETSSSTADNQVVYYASTSADRLFKIKSEGNTLVIKKIFIEDASTTSVTATVGANGYTTFTSPYALDLTDANRPEGLKAYAATLDGANLTFTELKQVVPAGTGLLLQGEAKGYNIPVVAAAGTAPSNALIGINEVTPMKSTANDNYFFVMKKASTASDALKFAPLTIGSTAVNVPAGKVVVEVPNDVFTSNNSRELTISFDNSGTTGINGLDNLTNSQLDNNAPMYNLAGQKVSKSYKGIVIVNGKKVVRK